MQFLSELLLGLDGGHDARWLRVQRGRSAYCRFHDGPGLGSMPVRAVGMPQGELAYVRVDVEELALASPIERGHRSGRMAPAHAPGTSGGEG
jgi:hypothetical protein